MKKVALVVSVAAALCLVAFDVSRASGEPVKKESLSQKIGNFVRKLFEYPANVMQGSSNVATDVDKNKADIVTDKTNMVGQAVTGETDKAKEAPTEPLTGTAETAVKAVEETSSVPAETAKEQ